MNKPFSALAAVLLLSSAVQAEDTVNTIVITAGRMAEPLEETPPGTVVIDRATIERSPAQDVADLLRQHAGVEIGRAGGPGQQTSVFIRGADSNHTLVLLDGVPINPGTIGNAAVQNIEPAQVDHIEIVKGPTSTLYGSGAIGGVINIITHGGAPASGIRSQLGLRAGGDNTRSGNASLQYGGEAFHFDIDVAHLETDGFPTRKASDLDRGHRNTSLNLSAGVRVGEADLRLSHWQTKGTTEYLGFALNPLDQDFRDAVTAFALQTSPSAGWDSTLRLSHMEDRIEQNQSDDFARTRRNQLDWQNDIHLGDTQTLTVVATLTREHTDSLSFGAGFNKILDSHEILLQDTLRFGNHDLTLAGRYIHHERFGDTGVWNIAWGYRLSDATRLSVDLGTAFRAPDSTDMFGFGGNPDLEPERSESIELGLRHRLGITGELRAALFHTEIKDLITFQDPDGFLGPQPGMNVNMERARITGLELGYNYTSGPWHLGLEAVFQEPKDRDSNRLLPRRARRSLTASLDYLAPSWDARLELVAASRRNDSAFNTLQMAGYGVCNLSGHYHLANHLSLEGSVLNLFDKDYELASNFRTQDRVFYAGIRFDMR